MPNRFSGTPPLPDGEAHIWLAWTDRFTEPSALDACRRLLSEEETERCGRFHFERDRHLYLVAHAMVRHTLAAYLELPPRHLQFSTNAYGRPELLRGPGMPNLRFNLSHTRGLAALVVNLDHDCGIDVEAERRSSDLTALATSVLSPPELEAFRNLPESDRPHAFLRYWTLKEAYIKARGQGLSLPLDRFSFEIREKIAIQFHAGIDDNPGGWQFTQEFPDPGHVLAVAIHHGAGPELFLSHREFAPSALASPVLSATILETLQP
ncbi:4'-phosphopantetheinyl transferase family protein [Methylomagnum sp.]